VARLNGEGQVAKVEYENMRGYLLFVNEDLVAESTTRRRLGEKVREKMMEESSGLGDMSASA